LVERATTDEATRPSVHLSPRRQFYPDLYGLRRPQLDDALLTNIFFLQLSVIGSTMGTRDELASLVTMLDATGVRPLLDRTLPMEDARAGFAAMAEGDVFGKIVLTR